MKSTYRDQIWHSNA